MKKELIAGAIIILLFAGSLYNIHYMNKLSDTLISEVDQSRTCTQSGDFEGAKKYLRSAIDKWMASDGYTHIFIRHPEIDSATDAFYELLSDIEASDAQSAVGSYEKLIAHLTSIAGMEHIKIGSIL